MAGADYYFDGLAVADGAGGLTSDVVDCGVVDGIVNVNVFALDYDS